MVSDSPGTVTGGGILSSLPAFNTSRTMPSTAVSYRIGEKIFFMPTGPPTNRPRSSACPTSSPASASVGGELHYSGGSECGLLGRLFLLRFGRGVV